MAENESKPREKPEQYGEQRGSRPTADPFQSLERLRIDCQIKDRRIERSARARRKIRGHDPAVFLGYAGSSRA